MPKMLVTLIVVAALVIDLALLLGIGFGTGALAAAPPQGQSFAPTWNNDTTGAGGAIQPNVYVQLGTLPLISSMLPGAGSTTLSFGMQVLTNNNCGNAGDPAWAPGLSGVGSGGAAYYEIQFLSNGQPEQITALVDGQQQSGTALFATNNGSFSSADGDQNVYACFYGSGGVFGGGGNEQSTNFGHSPFFLHTVQLIGLVGEGTLQISIPATGPLCDGSGSETPVCIAGESAAGVSNGIFTAAKGSWTTHSSVSVPVLSAQASLSLDGSGPWYNGGQVQLTASTGFAGTQGYELEILNPAARTGGGQVATGWGPTNPQSVGNNLPSATFTFTIPAGASQNCTVSGCNNFQAVLVSPLLDQEIPVPVDISPFYTPTQPGISYTASSGGVYPATGDTMTLTFNAGSNGTNNQVKTFIVYVFYLLSGQAVTDAKSCDSTWVTPCNGATLTATSTGSSNESQAYSATYTFTVNPPINTVSIGIRAQAETANQQSSGISYRQVSLLPNGCKVGTTCDPSHSALQLWSELGPILLSIAIVLAGILGLLYLPGMFRIIAPIGAVVLVAVLWLLGVYATWFGGTSPLG